MDVRMIIGLVGEHGAGKDTIARYLASEYKFKHISTGDIVRQHTKKLRGTTGDRVLQHEVAIKLRKDHGTKFLVKEALADKHSRLVISGLRHPDEVRAIKASHGVVLYVTANEKNRYARIKARNSTRDQLDFKAFLQQETSERQNDDVFAQHLDTVLSMSDFKIENDGGLDDLHEAVDAFIHKYFAV